MKDRTRTYYMQLREWYDYDLSLVATSRAEAMEKLEAFYAEHRKPPTTYQQEGLTATLQDKSVRCGRQSSSPSTWAKARAARDSDRDAA